MPTSSTMSSGFIGRTMRLGRKSIDRARRHASFKSSSTALKIIRESGLFSPSYYYEQNPAALSSGLHPIDHYIRYGESQGYRPHPLFDPHWYASEGGLRDDCHASYLIDFLIRGGAAGVSPHPLFVSSYYLNNRQDVRTVKLNPLTHFLRHGWLENSKPNPVFDIDWYKRYYKSSDDHLDPLSHFVTEGEMAGNRPNPNFDPIDYLRRYPDLVGAEPTKHFLRHGQSEGRVGYNYKTPTNQARIAIVAHVFYEDIWSDLEERLSLIKQPYDFYVTVPMENTKLAETIRASHFGAKISEVRNIGQDFLPLLTIMSELVEKNYTAVCKIHTKKGTTEPRMWRDLLLAGVIPNCQMFSDIINYFHMDDDLVLAGSADLNLDGKLFIGKNEKNLKKVSKLVGIDYDDKVAWSFFAGSMFWFRPAFFKNTARKEILSAFCEDEAVDSDGLTAHALERLFGYMAAMEGKRTLLVDTSDLGRQGPLEAVRSPGPARTAPFAMYLSARAAAAERARPTGVVSDGTVSRPSGGGLNLVGPVNSVNGLGVSARGYAQAVVGAELALNVVPWTLGFDRVAEISITHPTAAYQPVNLIHLNLDFMWGIKLLDIEPLKALMDAAAYNICIPYWELAAIPQDWIETINRFDEIWTASSFARDAIAAITRRPVHVVRPAMTAGEPAEPTSLARFAIPQDAFAFFYSADYGSVPMRKNPVGYWRAYATEFGPDEGTCCILKFGYADPEGPLVKEMKRIAAGREDMILILETLSNEEMSGLFARADCYVSPHRSEGLGLTVIEAMQAGKPVIATGYGGVGDFVRPDVARVISHRLCEVGPGSHPYPPHYVWADPIPESLRQGMREIYENAELRMTIARRGRETADGLFGVDVTASALRARIEQIYATAGFQLQR